MRCLNCEHADLPPGTQWCPGCESYLPLQVRDCLPSGTLLDHGKYRVEHVLGRGGFGITYLGHQVRLKRLLAIKEFFPREHVERSDSGVRVAVPSDRRGSVESARGRFLREAERLVRLCDDCGHDLRGVVHVLDSFEDERTETAYTVMEYVVGDQLRKELRAELPLDDERIRHVIGALVEALERVHGAGLVHLDLKPENVLVTPKGRVVLIDFGATARAGLGTKNSREYTEGYAPPEVAAKREVGPCSDVFELGMMLAEMALGRRPASAAQRIAALSMGEPDPLDLGAMGPPWRDLCDRALRIRPGERPASIRDWWMTAPSQPAKASTPVKWIDFAIDLERRRQDATATKPARRLEERRLGIKELLARMAEVLTDIDQRGRVYRVAVDQPIFRAKMEFVLGPAVEFSYVLGLVDKEYGWEAPVNADDVKGVDDVAPGYRRHPFVYQDGRFVAVSIQTDEYDQLKHKHGLIIDIDERVVADGVRDLYVNPIGGGAPVEFGFARVPAGRFVMGASDSDSEALEDESPTRDVVLTHSFEMLTTPVTQAQWEAVMGSNPAYFKGPERPVEQVSWYDAVAFCNTLSKALGLPAAYDLPETDDQPGEDGFAPVVRRMRAVPAVRLPTEAEWEYACRAGSAEPRYGALEDIAWYNENSGLMTHQVGRKLPNACGMYDMLGNVSEWCWDYWDTYPTGAAIDPTGPKRGLERVHRGGEWSGYKNCARASYRDYDASGFRCNYVGLRVVMSIGGVEGKTADLAVFEIVDGDGTPRRVEIDLGDGRPVYFGRSPTNDVVLKSALCGRRHGLVRAEAGSLTYVDLGAVNSTYLNGKRIVKAFLFEGDVLHLADVVVRLVSAGRVDSQGTTKGTS